MRFSPAKQLILLMTSFLLFGERCDSLCDTGLIQCKTSDRCIFFWQVCDRASHCPDGSDEEEGLCEFWTFDDCYYDSYQTTCMGNCITYNNFCNNDNCAALMDPKACQMVKEKTLRIEVKSGMILSDDNKALMTSVVNSSISQKRPECPMLYTRVGNQCLAFFSLARVPWPEARQFCQSIFGDLVSFKTLDEFRSISDYLKEALLTSDFWIGGRFDMDQNSWSWVSDDTPMPLGTPYWAMSYSSSCVRRPPPHTDPFSDPPAALPDAPCYSYVQSPRERQQGWCSAMTYEHFYYVSDESCHEARSPLCLLSHQLEV